MKRVFILLVSLLAMMAANLSVTAQETATAKASMGNNVNRSQASFITDGNWNDGSNWDTGVVPAPGSDVMIMANAVIPVGYTAVANEVSIEGGSITVADGGQLRHNTDSLVVTMKKNIEPYDDANGTDNYYLLAFPFSTDVAVPNAMTANEGCDFYKFDGDFLEAEWRNNKQEAIATVSGTTGYLYANSEAIELSLTGSTYPSYNEEVIPVTVPYDEGSTNPYNGWALLGNPFTCNAYVYCHNSDDELVPMEFMVYDATGELMTLSDEPIAPMQGFFVKVTETTTVYILNYAYSFHEYVDLGLPSGTLWATCNVGADTPEGYGDYYAWGETQPKDNYQFYTYQFGEQLAMSKYNSQDHLIVLLPEDDAATANWGANWRMARVEEWQELRDNTTRTWTTQNGVKGLLYTASNGNSIFMPAAGYRYGTSIGDAKSYGYYWTSSLGTEYAYNARKIYFYSNNYYIYNEYRCRGLSVRAVRSAPQSFIIEATVDPEESGTISGDGAYDQGRICTLTATANEGYVFNNWSENGVFVSAEPTITFTVNENRNLVAHFAVIMNGHAYVDLGLPSGMFWANCNVGADNPEDYGDYFAWGETQPRDYYSWSTYRYCHGTSGTLTKYCNKSGYGYNGFIDNLTTLLGVDDAATANWGYEWRMPTQEEWQELFDNTTNTWTTKNGVNGRAFTAANGNSVFMPAAGSINGSSNINIGLDNYCWSSSLGTNYPYQARCMSFSRSGASCTTQRNRFFGHSVRAVRVQSYTISVSVSPSDKGNVSGDGPYEPGSICTLTATPNEGYVFTHWTEDGEVVSTDATYSFMVTGDRNLVANFDHAYVNLGLPSGTLWATCNVGAETPEDYGDYFAWGETQPKDTYDWSTYQYCMGSNNTLTKYCTNAGYGYNGFTDNLTTLQPEDDAATANWSSDWCMPTQAQWQELLDNTTHTWTTQNGVNGNLYIASNGNSLFLPAAGSRLYYELSYFGSVGYYWSSSLGTEGPHLAWAFYCQSVFYGMDDWGRYYGQSVRGVRSVPLASYVINATVYPEEGGIVIGSGTYEGSAECTLTATPNEGYAFTHWTENGEVVSTDATYSFTVTGDRNLVAHFAVIMNGHAYVDLGLPSGLLWATCNVGADNPEDYGDYFAWGETQPKETYSWSTYQYCNGSYNTLTKYCNNDWCGYNGFTDNLTTLLPEDDAATANWGNGWRMPTKEEFQELYNNTTVTWTTQNGVNGRLFTASNGNILFLPAAGWRYNSSLDYSGSQGNYWSSSLDTGNPNYAWLLYFHSGEYFVNIGNRYYGHSVRAVRSVPLASYVINATAYPEEGGIVIGSGTYDEGAECTLTATPNEGYVFTHWTENGEVVSTDATYSFTVTGDRNLVANFDLGYVDLGLPSGTLWATYNVGADTPEEYGDYFAWGETQPKDIYDWNTYQYCNGDYNLLTKYCNNSSFGYNGFTDTLTTLLPEDDAATANWGANWRMPTEEEWQELYQNTTHTWTTQNGVRGRLFTASNGNSLFLPAAGYRIDSSLDYAGSQGYYWSSSLYTDYPGDAWYFYFDSDIYGMYRNIRRCGRSVRAVRSGLQN